MSDPLPYRGKNLPRFEGGHLRSALNLNKKNSILFVFIGVMSIGLLGKFWMLPSTSYAYAYTGEQADVQRLESPLFEKQNIFAVENEEKNKKASVGKSESSNEDAMKKEQSGDLEGNLFEIVGNTPIREMVPFMAKRDKKVAAFLVGIAKKESGFGIASPSKNGNDCHNYWGYKGVGSRGDVSGYSCFGSAQEAIETVGDRIETLVNKNLSTPARMVDTWKCGRSCSGDPGASSWVSTVALYFDKIVNSEG